MKRERGLVFFFSFCHFSFLFEHFSSLSPFDSLASIKKMDPLPPSAPLCACGTLAVWFPQTATTAAAANRQQQQQRGATATATATTTAAAPSSLLGPAFAALKSTASSSSAAGQWLVGKKPATLTMSSSSRGGVLVQARERERERERTEKSRLLLSRSHACFLSPASYSSFFLQQIHAGGRRLVAVSSPFPAACRMVPTSATTGEGEGEEGDGTGGGGGCWVLVAGVREDSPLPSSRGASPFPRGDDARVEGSRAPGSEEGQVRGRFWNNTPQICFSCFVSPSTLVFFWSTLKFLFPFLK